MCANPALSAHLFRSSEDILDKKPDRTFIFYPECWSIETIVLMESKIAYKVIYIYICFSFFDIPFTIFVTL